MVWPTPFVFDSHIAFWQRSLDSLRALGATTLIPGHGPIMRDDRFVALVSEALRAIRLRTEAAKGRGFGLDSVRTAVDVRDIGRRFTGDDKVRRLSWKNYFVGAAVQRAYEEAGGAPSR